MTEEKDIASATHPMYDALEAKRDVFRAVMGGTDSMRAAGKRLLPQYPAEDPKDYDIRLQSSTIDGLVQGGVESLCGNVFDGEINTTDVADKLKPWLENIDNQGNSFNIFARNVFRESFTGIVAVMADR